MDRNEVRVVERIPIGWALEHGICPTFREQIIPDKRLELKALLLWLRKCLNS